MYRDGNFQSLRWNMLEASHKAHWEKLSSVYGLEEPEKLLKSEAQKKDMPVLDQLAELCICSCQNYLFSLTPVKDVSNSFHHGSSNIRWLPAHSQRRSHRAACR